MEPFDYLIIIFLVFQVIFITSCWLFYISEFCDLKKNYPLQGGKPLSFWKYQFLFNTVYLFPRGKLGEFYQQIDEIYPGASQKIEARRKKSREIIFIIFSVFSFFWFVCVYSVLFLSK